MKRPSVTVTTDASGSWGCGALFSLRWFQFKWQNHLVSWNITAKELFPILLAAATWGREWHSCHVVVNCDNEAVVTVVNKGSARDPVVGHLLHCLHFFAVHYQFSLSAVHISGRDNTMADALSRNHLQSFFFFPQADPVPVQIPQAVLLMASNSSMDWTSPAWRQLFQACINWD